MGAPEHGRFHRSGRRQCALRFRQQRRRRLFDPRRTGGDFLPTAKRHSARAPCFSRLAARIRHRGTRCIACVPEWEHSLCSTRSGTRTTSAAISNLRADRLEPPGEVSLHRVVLGAAGQLADIEDTNLRLSSDLQIEPGFDQRGIAGERNAGDGKGRCVRRHEAARARRGAADVSGNAAARGIAQGGCAARLTSKSRCTRVGTARRPCCFRPVEARWEPWTVPWVRFKTLKLSWNINNDSGRVSGHPRSAALCQLRSWNRA